MKKPFNERLRLDRQTVAGLNSGELRQVLGGNGEIPTPTTDPGTGDGTQTCHTCFSDCIRCYTALCTRQYTCYYPCTIP